MSSSVVAVCRRLLTKCKDTTASDSPLVKFMCNADKIERWIKIKENQLELTRDSLAQGKQSLQRFHEKQLEFVNSLLIYKTCDICRLSDLKSQLIKANHDQKAAVIERHDRILQQWSALFQSSDELLGKLAKQYTMYKADKILTRFAKKATGVYTWLELAKKELVKPVDRTSNKEITDLRHVLSQMEANMCKVMKSFEELDKLDTQIKAYNVPTNPYTRLTTASLRGIWNAFQEEFNGRRRELDEDTIRL